MKLCVIFFIFYFFRIRVFTSGWKQVTSETLGIVLNISDMAEVLANNVCDFTKS